MPRNETRTHRRARALQRETGLSYQQALHQIRTAEPGPTRRTVYVTTADGGLGDIVIDGDVTVASLDWANTDFAEFDPQELAFHLGVRENCPRALFAAIEDSVGENVVYEPTLTEDGSWAFVEFHDQTFTSDAWSASDDVTVVYFDWSLWYADLRYGTPDIDLEAIAAQIDALGPSGRKAARATFDDFVSRAGSSNTCARCGETFEDDPDGSEGVIVHSRELDNSFDLDEDHVPVRFTD